MKIETYTDYRIPECTIVAVVDGEHKIMILKKTDSVLILDNSSVLTNNELISTLPKAKQIAVRLAIESNLPPTFNITEDNVDQYANY